MSFSIEPIRPVDTEELINVHIAAYTGDMLHDTAIPSQMTPDQRVEYLAWRIANHDEAVNTPNTHFFKAIDRTTGRIAGYAAWTGPAPTEQTQSEEESDSSTPMPSCLNVAFMEKVEARVEEAKKRTFGEREDFWTLQQLLVHPEYQRRGVAKQLLQHGVSFIDEACLDCFLYSTPKAVNLYKEHGFQLFEEVLFLDDKYAYSIMVKQAERKEAREDWLQVK